MTTTAGNNGRLGNQIIKMWHGDMFSIDNWIEI